MRLYPFGLPKIRKKQIEYAEQIRNTRTVGYKSVHIGRTMLQLFPRTDIKTVSEHEYNYGRQKPYRILHIGYVYKQHTYDHYRYRQRDCQNGIMPQPAILFPVLRFRFIGTAFCIGQQVISCIPDSSFQIGRRTKPGIIYYLCRSRSIIDICFMHSIAMLKRLAHTSSTRGATHAHYRKRFFFSRFSFHKLTFHIRMQR